MIVAGNPERPAHRITPLKYAPTALVAPVALAVSVIVWAVFAVAGSSLLVAVAPAAAAGVLAAALLRSMAPRSALGALRARPLAKGDHPRLGNLIDGLCTTHGFHEPSVHVVETPAINAASVGLRRSAAHLVVTRGALSSLDRLELEAVVARQLCEIRRGVAFPTVLASVSRIPGAATVTARLAARTGGFDAVSGADVEATRLTSFPPALASALHKAVDGPGLNTARAAAHLWMVAPHRGASADRTRSSTRQRINVLGEI